MQSPSQLEYATEFESCEAENLRQTGAIQAGFRLIAIRDAKAVAYSANLNGDTETLSQALQDATETSLNAGHYTLVDAGDKWGQWLRHQQGELAVYEQPLHPAPPNLWGADAISLEAERTQARGNMFKFCQHVCSTIRGALGAERVMVYRFHADWSGEVIAEDVEDLLDPFLGLHYPPTDIPRQARELFRVLGSRHIFSTRRTDTPVHMQEGESLDLSLAVSRNVSPFHIEYLRNMGSESTASASILIDGQLWGLLSLHFSDTRPPNLEEVFYLQSASRALSRHISDLISDAEDQAQARQTRITDGFAAHLETHSDPFNSLILGDFAPHRVLNAAGASLIIDQSICNVGRTPTPAALKAIVERHGHALAELETDFVETLDVDASPADLREVAGCAITRISKNPDTFLILHRTEMNQQVNWGGDPRHSANEDKVLRYTPRKSFEIWVERVTGRCAPWLDLNRQTLRTMMSALTEHFAVSPRELALLIRNGLNQTTRKRDIIRSTALDVIDGIQVAIAIGIEETGEGSGKIIALNRSASDAFAISRAEVANLPVSELEAISGAPITDIQDGTFMITITTANAGVRQCEVTVGLIFELIDATGDTPPYRIQVFEFRDITEAKRIEATLTASRDRARRETELRTEYFAKLGHELKTPLNGLIGISDLLLRYDKTNLSKRASEKVQILHGIASHMSSLVTSSLENASSIQTVDQAGLTPVQLKPLIANCAQILKAKLSEHEVSVRIDDSVDCSVFSDARGLMQVLVNIMTNAIKYNVRGGAIEVTGRPAAHAMFTVSITDSGVGMTEEQVNNCMTPYTRFSNGDGAGLGLSIANNLMAIMGGVIRIGSEPNVGTTVELTLPTQDQTAHAPSGRQARS